MEVIAVHSSREHRFSKRAEDQIELIAGLGVRGDAHCGARVKHRSRVAKDATQPNLRQVHLMHAELHEELREAGYEIEAGDLGENITTRGIDLLALPTGTTLRVGERAIIAITGLRNPCGQIDAFRPGLLAKVAYKDSAGKLVRKAGVMGVVVLGGVVRRGDRIEVALPAGPPVPLERV